MSDESGPTCPTCGSAVEVVGGDEGTMSYRPVVAADRAPVFAALAAERDGLRREVQRLRRAYLTDALAEAEDR